MLQPTAKPIESGDSLQRDIGLELKLGIFPEDAKLELEAGSQRQDLQPWLMDAVAVRISCLGHQDEAPRPWDWENVLTLLEPGEELLYVLDHRAVSEGRNAGTFSLWLAIRFSAQVQLDAEILELRQRRAKVIIAQIRRQAFPGSEVNWVPPDELLALLSETTGPGERCMAVTGMPSPKNLNDDMRDLNRDEGLRNYQSLNDVAEALYDLRCDYRIAFVVQRLSRHELETELEIKSTLYDRIHPLVERSVRDGQNWSKQWGENIADAEAQGENSTKQSGRNRGTNTNLAPLGAVVGAGVGAGVGTAAGPVGAHLGMAIGGALGGALGGIWNKSEGESSSESTGKSWTTTKTRGTSWGENVGSSADSTVQQVNSLLRLADRSLERTIDALYEATGTGGFRWATFVFSNGNNAEIIGRSLLGVLAGARSKDCPLVRFEVEGERNHILARQSPVLQLIQEAAPIVSLPRVCDALLLPEAELPGLRLRRNVFFGRNIEAQAVEGELVELGPDAFSALGSALNTTSIRIPYSDLFRHILVAGTTGSGKTIRVVEVLNRLRSDDLSVVVFETAKRTYRSKFKRVNRPLPLVYALGSSSSYGENSRYKPLRLNPFFFELGTSLKRHIAVLGDALAELMPTESMIGPLLRRAVEACYLERGWDIEKGLPKNGLVPAWPSVVDFVEQVGQIAASLNYGPEVNANYRGALESRASLFVDPTFQDIFGYGGNGSINEIFPKGYDSIIEVEDLPPTDVDIRAFVMTILLNRLRSFQSVQSNSSQDSEESQREWLVVVEEAHNVLDREFEQRRPSNESNAGRTLLRTVVRLLQEGREMRIGLMVVDQAPTKLAKDVISNTGTKIILRLEDAAEMAEIGRAMGLEDKAWGKFGFLQVGEALVKASYMDRPAKSIGFDKNSLSPRIHDDGGEGWSPSFVALADLWRPVFEGNVLNRPDDAWLAELVTEAGGNPYLAVFAGARVLLVERGLSNSLEESFRLRAMLASNELDVSSIFSYANDCWGARVKSVYCSQLMGVASLICRSLVESSVWRNVKLSDACTNSASGILARLGYGDWRSWRNALLDAQEGGGMAIRGRKTIAKLVHSRNSLDRTEVVRAIFSLDPFFIDLKNCRLQHSRSQLNKEIYRKVCCSLINDLTGEELSEPLVESLITEIAHGLERQVIEHLGGL